MTSGAEECGSSTAPQGLSQRSKPPILLAKTAVAGLHREARFSPSLVLTSGAAEIYKPGIRHAAASVRRRVFEAPHRYSVTRLPIVIGGPPASTTLGFDDPPVPPEGGITLVPGCLTGESEERETWTAESLRAVSSEGQPFAEMAGRDFGGRRFRSTPISRKRCFCGAMTMVRCKPHACIRAQEHTRTKDWWDLVKRCDLPGKVLIQLESLILAQSERWRQA
jgi:hypothetical protein